MKPPRRITERDNAIAELVKLHAKSTPDPARRSNAEAFLQHAFAIPIESLKDPIDFWNELHGSSRKLLVRNAHHRYRQALAWAYAVYDIITNSGDKMERHLVHLFENQPVGRKPDILLATVRAVIEYGDGWRGDASRDAQAIRYLQHHNFGPHEVEAFYKQHGGGVDKWARLYSAVSKDEGAEAIQAQKGAIPTRPDKEAKRKQRKFVAKRPGGSLDCLDHALATVFEVVRNDGMWAFVIERQNETIEVTEHGYLGSINNPFKGQAIDAWLKIGEALLREPGG